MGPAPPPGRGVMRWMTRRWHGGPMSDAEEAALQAGYRAHVDAMRRRGLPPALRVFLGEPDPWWGCAVHDGRVEWWALEADRAFTLQLFGGDDPVGYRRVVIQYRGRVELFGASAQEVAGWLDAVDTELLYDEVDVTSDGRFEHRFLLWPRGEFGVRFEDVDVVAAVVPGATHAVVMRRKRLEASALFGRLTVAWEAGRRRAYDAWLRLDDLRDRS